MNHITLGRQYQKCRRIKCVQTEIVGPNRRKSRLLPPSPFPREVVESLVFLDRAAEVGSRQHAGIVWIRNCAARIYRLKISISPITESGPVHNICSLAGGAGY